MQDLFVALVLAAMFMGVVSVGILNVLTKLIERKKAGRPLFGRIDEEELVGEKRHCDGYHAGNFYW